MITAGAAAGAWLSVSTALIIYAGWVYRGFQRVRLAEELFLGIAGSCVVRPLDLLGGPLTALVNWMIFASKRGRGAGLSGARNLLPCGPRRKFVLQVRHQEGRLAVALDAREEPRRSPSSRPRRRPPRATGRSEDSARRTRGVAATIRRGSCTSSCGRPGGWTSSAPAGASISAANAEFGRSSGPFPGGALPPSGSPVAGPAGGRFQNAWPHGPTCRGPPPPPSWSCANAGRSRFPRGAVGRFLDRKNPARIIAVGPLATASRRNCSRTSRNPVVDGESEQLLWKLDAVLDQPGQSSGWECGRPRLLPLPGNGRPFPHGCFAPRVSFGSFRRRIEASRASPGLDAA